MPRSTTIDLAPPVEKAFLVAVDTGDDPGWTAEDSLAELAALADTAGAEVVGAEWQNRRHVDPNWYVGKGKAEELLSAKAETGFTLLIADDELSPGPAARPRGALEGQGHRPQPPHPRHLRPPRADPRGAPPGRAGPARVPAAAADPAVDAPVAHRRRDRHAGSRRDPARDRPADHPRADQEDEGARRGRPAASARRPRAAATGASCRPSSIVGYTNAGKSTLLNALVGSEVDAGRGQASSRRSTRRAAR